MNRGVVASALLLSLVTALIVTFVLLGNWQLQRLAWKTELIDTVEARAFGEPVAAPQGKLDPELHSYRRLTVSGTFLHDRTRFVKAVTELGPGFWIMTPLQEGTRNLWINRGFVPSERRSGGRYAEPAGAVTVTGLLRATEPEGTLLQANDPSGGRWYSRDVAALSRDAGIETDENWFIDVAREDAVRDDPAGADATAEQSIAPPRWPRAGLTRIDFRNTHLAYALTWYAMALALVLGSGYVVYLERRR